jgi:hypothetical protein
MIRTLEAKGILSKTFRFLPIHDGRKMSNEIEQLKKVVQKLQETVTRLSGER